MDMTPERWEYTKTYSRRVFGRRDAALDALIEDAKSVGLPNIAISADVGRLLMMLTSMTLAKLAIEVGTLGGFSAIWLARGLAESGKLITIEIDPDRALFAQRHFENAGVADRVELRLGDAMEVLPQLADELGPDSVDVVFLDAEKSQYVDYWRAVRPLIKPGGLIIADNVYGSITWWIDNEGHPDREGADRFNRIVAEDAQFEAVAVPIREGVLIGRRVR